MRTRQLWARGDAGQRWRQQAFVWHNPAGEQKIFEFTARVSGGAN